MTGGDAVTVRRGHLLALLRYLVIGGLSIVIDVGLLYALHQVFGVVLAAATAIAFLTSLLVNFGLNRGGMAGRDSPGLGRHAVRFLFLVALNLIITLVVVTSATRIGISYLIAKLAVVAASTAWNFPLYRYWVFAGERGATDPGRAGSDELWHYAAGMDNERSQRLLVVIPAFNEEGAVGEVVTEVRSAVPDAGILVVDDASLDRTRDQALSHGAMVLSVPINLGVGGAMRAGFLFAQRNGYGPVVQVDGDGQHDPRQIPLLIDALADADVVIGARFAGTGNYAVRGPRRWAMRVLSVTLSRIAKTKLTDTTSGFRAASPRAVAIFARHYPAEYLGDTVESIVISARAGLVVRQVPVSMRARAAGRPSQPSWRALLYLLRACIALCFAGMRWRSAREFQRVDEGHAQARSKEAPMTTELASSSSSAVPGQRPMKERP